jgi:uncharacterized protein DUF6494
MQDDRVSAAVSNFLRHVGHTAQHEIEKVVRKALAEGTIKRAQDLPAAITVHSDQLDLDITIHSRIEL